MSSFGACLVAVAVGGLIGLTIAYAVVVDEIGSRAAARLIGYVAVVYVLTVAVLMALSIGFHGSARRHITEVVLLAFTVLTWASIGWLLAGRIHGGRALVTLPRLPRQWLALGAVVLMVLVSLGQWGHPGGAIWIMARTEQVSFVLWIVLTAVIRPQLRERGALLFGTLLPWRLLQSYAWEGESGQTLTLRRRRLITGWLLAYPRLSLRVPIEQQEQVDALLRQHLECTEPLRSAEERGTADRGRRQTDFAERGAPSPLGRIPVSR